MQDDTQILIVDDSDVMRERLKSLLSEIEGIEIAGEASDARQAVDAIGRLKPDVVILDIRMPEGSGIDVLKALPRNGGGKSARVMVFTNFPFPQYRKACIDLGADYFFDKSQDFNKLCDTLRQFVAERRTE